MSLNDIELKETYWSGDNDLIKEFYIPCLNNSIYYDRAVGFFSSSILKYISDGLYNFIQNEGTIRLICSLKLSESDQKKIEEGYRIKSLIEKKLNKEIEHLLLDKDKPNVQNLCWLIKNERLDIKICLKKSSKDKLFHEKFGIFKDEKNNILSFMGSINESVRGWMYNEESFEVSYSWEKILKNRVLQKVERFEKLWTGVANEINTYKFPEASKKILINVAPEEPINKRVKTENKVIPNEDFIPRKCQLRAYQKYKDDDYICLFQMATGAGKTKAALYSFQKTPDWKLLLILVPNMDLVDQWEEDVKYFFPNDYLIKCSSKFRGWKQNLLDVIQAKVPFRTILISTYDSAVTNFAFNKWKEIDENKFAMICDEVHNLGANQSQKLMNLNPKYRIGLSATPERNYDEEGTEKILNFYNNNTYSFTIKEAIRAGYLVEYEYYVFPCFLTEEEWSHYLKLSKKISKLSKISKQSKNDKEDNNILQQKLRERANILKRAEEKLDVFTTIIEKIPKGSRVLVYGDSKEHLTDYAKELESINKDYFVYTGDKDVDKERPLIMEEFKLGIRKILLAIKCLDEGIDIPSCDCAVFVSSTTSKRQFIQRRGRVLRKSIGKSRAYIYDYIVIPVLESDDEYKRKTAKQIIQKEYDRINIISDDAINGIDTKNKLDDVLDNFGLNPFKF